jgi:EAL domain-containing protein (putative c-di-GMP-specific phosphodiesterase class I)
MEVGVFLYQSAQQLATTHNLQAYFQPVLEALVDMTRKMGRRVLAKNLESVEDFRIARWMGVTLLQGYLFGVPGPISLWKEHPFPQEWHLRGFMRRPATLIPPPDRSKPTSRDIIH